LGQFIEQTREDLGLTKSEAARLAGVSRGTWREVESGSRTQMLADTLNLMDKALGLSRGTLRAKARELNGTDIPASRATGDLLLETSLVQDVVGDDRAWLLIFVGSRAAPEQIRELRRCAEAIIVGGHEEEVTISLSEINQKVSRILLLVDRTEHDPPAPRRRRTAARAS